MTNIRVSSEYGHLRIQHRRLCSIRLCGPFTLGSLTRHKTRSNLPHPSYRSHAPTDLIQLRKRSVHLNHGSYLKEDHFHLCAFAKKKKKKELAAVFTGFRYYSRRSPPYGRHSLNSYNICLCQDNRVHSANQQHNNGHISLRHKIISTMKYTVKAFKAFFTF